MSETVDHQEELGETDVLTETNKAADTVVEDAIAGAQNNELDVASEDPTELEPSQEADLEAPTVETEVQVESPAALDETREEDTVAPSIGTYDQLPLHQSPRYLKRDCREAATCRPASISSFDRTYLHFSVRILRD